MTQKKCHNKSHKKKSIYINICINRIMTFMTLMTLKDTLWKIIPLYKIYMLF